MKAYVQVILADAPRVIDKDWTYRIPEEMREDLEVGCQVLVPFGRQKKPVQAYVSKILDRLPSSIPHETVKNLAGFLSDRPLVTEEQILLAREMRRRYYGSAGDALKAMVPPTVLAVQAKKVLAARLTDPDQALEALESGELRSLKQVRVIELLLEHESASCSEIRQAAGLSQSVIQALAKKGLVDLFRKEEERAMPEEATAGPPDLPPELTPAQEQAVEAIRQALEEARPGQLTERLLFGITGSGKTEVYLRAAESVLARGRQVLILVPEIALTPQMTRRLTSRFGDRVAILHSRMTPAGRYASWQKVLAQKIPIVVGARSAIFAPLDNLGLIVIDEEQESSYKAEMKPRYYALDIGRMRAMMKGAVLVLGSATPQVQSYHRALSGSAQLLTLPGRIGEGGLAEVETVDMRREYSTGNLSLFSRRFQDLMEEVLARGDQAMILMNRRGFSRTLVCQTCGWQMTCPSCDIALTGHLNPYGEDRIPRRMVCHLCDRILSRPDFCPDCGHEALHAAGAGTQQVEEALQGRFPGAKVLRMDQDTTRGRFSHRQILDDFEAGRADILVGTQMIAKGHDFHNVTLSAILSADQLLATGDFRAQEQAFQLMTQAAGRSGRGLKKGRVIIQTFQPDHFVIEAAARQDYEAFYKEEIIFRERMGYLPYGHLALAEFRGYDPLETEEAARAFHRLLLSVLRHHPDLFCRTSLSDPAPSPVARVRNRYRFRIIGRDPSVETLTRLFFFAGDEMKKKDRVSLVIDIDPWSGL